MGIISTLAIRLVTDTSDLAKGISDANAKVSGMGLSLEGAMHRAGDAVLDFGKTLGIGFGLHEIVSLEEKVLEFGSTIADLSLQTGIGTKGLQELNYAAVGSGLTIEQLATGISQMSRRIALGDNSAVDAMSRLGLSLSDIQSQSPEAVFYQIADAVLKIPNPMQQTAIMTELFGRAGAQYLPLIKDNLQEIREEAQKSIIPPDMITKADQLDDAWHRMWIHGKALVSEVLIPLTDLLTSRGSRYSILGQIGVGDIDNLKAVTDLAKQKAPDLGGMMPAGLPQLSSGELTRAAKDLDDQIKKANDEYREMKRLHDAAFGLDMIDKVNKTIAAIGGIEGVSHMTDDAMKSLHKDVLAAMDAAEKNGLKVPPVWNQIERATYDALGALDAYMVKERQLAKETTDLLGRQLEEAVKLGSPKLYLPTIDDAQTRDLLLNPGNAPGVGAQTKAILQHVETMAEQIRGKFTAAFDQIPELLTRSLLHSGGFINGLKAIGFQMGDAIIEPLIKQMISKLALAHIGNAIASAIGLGGSAAAAAAGGTAATGGALAAGAGAGGAGLGGLMTNPWTAVAAGAALLGVGIWKKGWFRGGEEATMVNPARDAFMSQFQVGESAHLSRNDALIKKLEDSGLGGENALALMQALNSADTMEKFNIAKGRIETSLADAKKKMDETKTANDALTSSLGQGGEALKALADKLTGFSDTLLQGFQSVVGKLDEMIAKLGVAGALAGTVTAAAAGAAVATVGDSGKFSLPTRDFAVTGSAPSPQDLGVAAGNTVQINAGNIVGNPDELATMVLDTIEGGGDAATRTRAILGQILD